MSRRQHVSSIDVARESLRTGKLVIESMPQRTKRIKRWLRGLLDAVMADRNDARARDAYDNPAFMFSYGVNGVQFIVCVHERERWYQKDDVDGLSVMIRDGGEHHHITARFDDLPAPVRAVARDVRAAMTHGETAGERAAAAKWARRNARDRADMRRRHPKWYDADGNLDRAAMAADVARNGEST